MTTRHRRHPAPRRHAAPDKHTAPVISLRCVDAMRNRELALADISLDFCCGSIAAVIGPNGAGKSTLFAVMSQRLRPTRGSVHVSASVAEVLQSSKVDDQMALTVEDVVRMGRYQDRGLLRPLRRADRVAVADAIDRMKLGELRRRPIGALSGGQRQRALVAQALAQQAEILLLDEPTTGLDHESHGCIVRAIDDEAREGRAVIYATHDLGLAQRADTVIALAQSCLCCAPPNVAFARDDVAALFTSPEIRPAQFDRAEPAQQETARIERLQRPSKHRIARLPRSRQSSTHPAHRRQRRDQVLPARTRRSGGPTPPGVPHAWRSDPTRNVDRRAGPMS